jgi:methylamine---glutamate N-methyltransferase subunit A
MCGIVGLLLKKPALHQSLGALATPMLECMGERGPDSAGLAIFAAALPESERRFCLYSADELQDWEPLLAAARAEFGGDISLLARSRHAVLTGGIQASRFRPWLTKFNPKLKLLSVGREIEVYKDAEAPVEVALRYDFRHMAGTHAVGHTRMATESAVSPAHAHPFTAGEDFCLVHNGSLSNPYSLRRKLEKRGVRFETDNDTEAACRFLEWRMREGDTLELALHAAFRELDGFYTLVMATAGQIVLVRDAFACKPAVVAETDDYVAIASEFRSLAHLPGIADARLFEPMPEEIYAWRV